MKSRRGPKPRVYTIPAEAPFLPWLARAVLEHGFPARTRSRPSPVDLPNWTILLPTRRAVRELGRAFLEAGGMNAAILPRIRPIGDVDEDELAFFSESDIDPALPPAISATRRLFLLARLISEWARDNPSTGLARGLSSFPGQTFALARSLGKLVDSFDTDEVSLDGLEKLAGADFAEHRAAMLDFLAIIRRRLPEEMTEMGVIGAARRRSLLLHREASTLEAFGAKGPIIAAGSTGSIPATANLLRVIARLGEAAVVLPGLDLDLDDTSWQAVSDEPGHPQYGLKQLLTILGVDRRGVEYFPGTKPNGPASLRSWLASEIMRPVATTDQWRQCLTRRPGELGRAMQDVEVIEAADQRQEAQIIALIMRRSLELPGATASLVTPSRRLARRVKAELRRWSIEVDDTAGEPLSQTSAGGFLRLILELGLSRFGAREFVQLVKHPVCRLGQNRHANFDLIAKLEIAVLRGPSEPQGLAGIAALLRDRQAVLRRSGEPDQTHHHPSLLRLTTDDFDAIAAFLDRFGELAYPFIDLLKGNDAVPLGSLLSAHLTLAERLAIDENGRNILWRGEDGEVLSQLFAALLEQADTAPPLSPADYGALFAAELQAHIIRPRFVSHSRLSIMGLLEARLMRSDLMILAGLNHGLWPPEPEMDPWLSRPMKAELGLAPPERRIGLSAHDFVQCFASPRVCLTHSRKIDSRPTVPSRWLLRLAAITRAAAPDEPRRRASQWREWAKALEWAAEVSPAPPPQPCPPLTARPASLSVTRIEKLIANPYALYAEKVLALEPLHPIAKPLGAADRGLLIHDALCRFGQTCRGDLPANACDRLIAIGREVFAPCLYDPQVAAFWWPQFERIAAWFIEHESALRSELRRQHFECTARASLTIAGSPFLLTARADRIDELSNGALRIIDYKTGQLPTQKAVENGHAPQLPLEAWLAGQGAFADIVSSKVSELMFIRLSGGQLRGESSHASKRSPDALAEDAILGLHRLLRDYASPHTPYLAVYDEERPSTPGDVDHLARTREWMFSGEARAPR
jgi:ATP-dependent helicase/nuclease subunit B